MRISVFVQRIWDLFITIQNSVFYYIFLFCKHKKVRIPRRKSNDLFILVNGPSLNSALKNKSKLKNKTLMCVNMMVNTDDYEFLKPSYYVIADVKFWQKMKGISENSFLMEEQEKWDLISDNLVKKTKWDMVLFLPDLAKDNKELTRKLRSNKHISIVYFNIGVSFIGAKKVVLECWKKQLCLPELQNVLILCIYTGIVMKFKKMYLIGSDHSFFKNFYVDKDNNFYYEYSHSYDNKQSYKVPYDSYGNKYNVGRVLKEYASLWEIYEKLKIFAEKNDTHIYNCCENSLIDVFDKISLDKVI